jgi:hypothetical protein
MNTKLLIKKALQSPCRYRVSAMGIDEHGKIIGTTFNKPRMHKKGGGFHAEALLMKKFGKRIKQIIICRVNDSGKIVPLDACSACQGLADKLGIQIISVNKGIQ